VKLTDRPPVFEVANEREQFRQHVVVVHRPRLDSLGDVLDGGDRPRVVADERFDGGVAGEILAHRRLRDAEVVGDGPLGQPALVEPTREHRPDGRQDAVDDEFAREHQRHGSGFARLRLKRRRRRPVRVVGRL
jgi:hypothetical protein